MGGSDGGEGVHVCVRGCGGWARERTSCATLTRPQPQVRQRARAALVRYTAGVVEELKGHGAGGGGDSGAAGGELRAVDWSAVTRFVDLEKDLDKILPTGDPVIAHAKFQQAVGTPPAAPGALHGGSAHGGTAHGGASALVRQPTHAQLSVQHSQEIPKFAQSMSRAASLDQHQDSLELQPLLSLPAATAAVAKPGRGHPDSNQAPGRSHIGSRRQSSAAAALDEELGLGHAGAHAPPSVPSQPQLTGVGASESQPLLGVQRTGDRMSAAGRSTAEASDNAHGLSVSPRNSSSFTGHKGPQVPSPRPQALGSKPSVGAHMSRAGSLAVDLQFEVGWGVGAVVLRCWVVFLVRRCGDGCWLVLYSSALAFAAIPASHVLQLQASDYLIIHD